MFHEPVFVEEVLQLLRPDHGTIVDATCGGGGHARAILERSGRVRLLGLDLDPEAIASAQARLGSLYDNLDLRQASYVDMAKYVTELGLQPVTGVLFDFGVSLHQLRTPERGFGHSVDGPLDMRFAGRRGGPTALQLIRRSSRRRIMTWLREHGEEPFSGRIARVIHERQNSIQTTGDLAEAVRSVVPARLARRSLARVFQALRIAVNNELDNIRAGLRVALDTLAPGGRIVTISYHSLEDRICKVALRDAAKAGQVSVLTRKPVRPGADEVARNPAARSARLRAAERLP